MLLQSIFAGRSANKKVARGADGGSTPLAGEKAEAFYLVRASLYGGLTMSDEAHWAAAVATETDDDAVTPFAACNDNAAMTYPNNMGATQTLTAGFANRFAWVTAVGAVAGAIPITETVVTVVTKAEAETRAADIDAAANVCIGSTAGGSQGTQSDSAGDKN